MRWRSWRTYLAIDFDITNTGTVRGGEAAFFLTGEGAFTNNGRIEGAGGIYWYDSNATLFLGRNSIIETTDAGAVRSNAGGATKTVNEGLIKAAFALQGGEADDRLINKGTINGVIQLFGGDDVFVNSTGKFRGVIEGNEGNDVFTVNSARTLIVETAGQGNDTVKARVSYALDVGGDIETLVLTGRGDINGEGDSSANAISGNSGANRLAGLGGNDVLTGAGGRDIFVMKTAFANDTVADFQNGTDRIDVSQWAGVDGFADIRAGAVQQDAGVLITIDSDSLLLADVLMRDLDRRDFIF